MEKTNKYYSVIENLVRNHKKFQGLDAILDDIIDDVFAHSEVIINSINNDSVIQAYLEKVVSTSIITVPKKMGFHSEIRHRVVSAQAPEVSNILQNEAEKENKEDIQHPVDNKDIVNNDLVDKMINSMPANESLGTHEVETPDELVAENSKENLVLEKDLDADLDTELNSEFDFEKNDNVEKLKDTSDFSNLAEMDDELESEDTTLEEVENLEIEDKNIDDARENQDIENQDVENKDVEELNIEELGVEDLEGLEELDDVELNQENEQVQSQEQNDFELEQEQNIDSEFTPIDTEDDLLEFSEESLDMTPQETLELSEQISEPVSEQIAEQPLDILDDSLEDIAESITDTLENGIDEDVVPAENFKPIDYSVFTFAPQEKEEDVDVEEIKSSLEQLNSKHPELNILKIYDLKYKNNNSVSEIATQLNMEEEQVLEALNEMIAVV